MSTPGEVLAGAVARHVASRDAMATLAAEIEAERPDDAGMRAGAPEGDHTAAPPPPPGG